MTTIAISILSVLFGGSVCLYMMAMATNKRLRESLGRAKARLADLEAERGMQGGSYVIEADSFGCYSVFHIGPAHGTRTLVKVFDTRDSEYNLNEAVELVDYLKKSLCYD